MRDRLKQIVDGYKSLNLEIQESGYVQFSGQEAGTKRPVGIKILTRLVNQDPEIARSFGGLARTIRQLNHPNVETVKAVGEKEGLPYIITRVLEKAHPLTERLDQPWAVDSAADVVTQVGEALDHAYRKGLVHGALTPDSIVVQDDGRAVVTGIGWAEMQELVGSGVVEAASPYLAPERAAGQPADASADVYSLASVFYSMLAKHPPLAVKGVIPPPSRFNSDVPPAMDQVVLKGLARNPRDRYPDAKAFLTALGLVKLLPTRRKSRPAAGASCPECGAKNQVGRFCRKCGGSLEGPKAPEPTELPKSKLDEPIQVTHVDVGRVKVGDGVKIHEITIARPMSVATGELSDLFPDSLPMPQVNMESIWPGLESQAKLAMPEPPPMPVIDWAEMVPPMPKIPGIDDAKDESD